MRNRLKLYLFALGVSIWVCATGTAFAATTTINATANIVTATIVLTPVTNLDFGSIVATPAGATILIDASAGAAVSTVNSGAASITVAGTSGLVNVDSPVSATVNITYTVAGLTAPNPVDALNQAAVPANTMTFTGASIHTYSTGGGTNPGTLALTAGTTAALNIGGLLQVGAAQVDGIYSGVITVNVNY